MPPKKKQAAHNSYYYFMQEFKGRQGRHFKSMQEVAEAAAPHWARMTKEQRKPYEDRAAMAKNNTRYTSENINVEELENKEKREQAKIQEMKDSINYTLKMANSRGRIHEEMFFIIHMNCFCYCSSLEMYIPAEIAIAVFNLEEGVLDHFHKIIKPGPLPVGYASEAMLHSQKTHQLQPPMIGNLENNTFEVYNEMKAFLSNKLCGSKRFPVLYTENKYLKMTQQILSSWCDEFNEDKPLFDVYNLEYMFRMLKNTVANENVWPSDTYSIRELEKDVYAYTPKIACDFHQVTNVPLYCSQSTAIRLCYVICDNCCHYLQIQLTPGFHIPKDSYMKSEGVGSVESLASSQRSSALKPTTRDDDTDSVVSFSSKASWSNSSVCSETSSNFDSEVSFPPLRKKNLSAGWRNLSQPDTSNTGSSYAKAMGAGMSRMPAEMPSSVVDDMDKLSVSSSTLEDDAFSIGRTRGRGRGGGIPFNPSPNAFPPLSRSIPSASRGRGRRVVNTDED